MLVVTGHIDIAPGDVARARDAAEVMMRETLRETGCHVYEFSQVIGAENRFRVYEEWSDRSALEAHFRAPHMAVFRAALAEIEVRSREIAVFEAGQKEPLG